MGLYFIPSFTVFFSVISFFLNGSFFSADYRVVEPLASDVCPLDSEVNPGTFAGFFEGGPSACHLVGRAVSPLCWAPPCQGTYFEADGSPLQLQTDCVLISGSVSYVVHYLV